MKTLIMAVRLFLSAMLVLAIWVETGWATALFATLVTIAIEIQTHQIIVMDSVIVRLCRTLRFRKNLGG